MDKSAIRDAATIILIRNSGGAPSVLMGQRGAAAAFLPNKFVFPGGAFDPGDAGIQLSHPVPEPCQTRLAADSDSNVAKALPATAIRELWEETGLALGTSGAWNDAPSDWLGFASTGLRPSARSLRFVFRAITPPGRPRRFDARFFIANATALATDPDDFSAASDELSHLQWIPLNEVRGFDLPFITQVVLAEVFHNLLNDAPPAAVPFITNDDTSRVTWITE